MRNTTPSFITEVPLYPNNEQSKILDMRFDFTRMAYNAILGEGMKRLNASRHDEEFRQAKELSKIIYSLKDEKEIKNVKQKRTGVYNSLNKKYGFSEYSLMKWATENTGYSWIGDHIHSKTLEATAKQAWKALQKYSFSQNGRPKFRRKAKGIRCIDGKSGGDVRWKGDHIKWREMSIPAYIPPEDAVINHGIKQPVKYTRLIKKQIRNDTRYFAQLVNEGQPLIKPKYKLGKGRVGIDLGTQAIAVYAHDFKIAFYEKPFEIKNIYKQIRILQRKIDRQNRASNPDCYNLDGTFIKGKKLTIFSNKREIIKNKLNNLNRKQVEYRKNAIGQFCHKIIGLGDEFFIEETDIREWQKKHGKSIGIYAPGMFKSMLEYNIKKLGGKICFIDTYKTRLSQVCICGNINKKSLRNRWHHCECGVDCQRDLFSAFLAIFVKDNVLDAAEALKEWKQGSCMILQSASGKLKTTSRWANTPTHLETGQSGSVGRVYDTIDTFLSEC